MFQLPRSPRAMTVLAAAAAAAGLALAAPTAAFASSGHNQAPQHGHHGPQPRDVTLNQVDLASDIPGLAPVTDPNLKNPWGNSLSPTSPLWISNQASDNATVYSIAPGSATATKSTAVQVSMPDSVPGPSGQAANTGTGFVLSNGTVSAPAAFIFATLDGHIEAWSPQVDPLTGNAEDKATVRGAGYTGLAIATSHGGRLFAADFLKGTIDVFDSAFHQVKTAAWQFTDPRLPAGLRPFNTQALNGRIFVTYDIVNPATGFEGTGPHAGAVDEFSTDGRLISRIVSGGALDAPWGLAIAPSSWGPVAGSLLVGNFGDGRINIIARHGDHFAHRVTGQILVAATGQPFAEPGLWGIRLGTTATGGTNALLFTAGLNDEHDGLLGLLRL